MMLYPPLTDLVDKVGSRYQLVNLVARRARDISTENEENGISSDEKSVSEAINEVYSGRIVALEHPEVEEPAFESDDITQ